jgi:hypothetical protein
VVYGDAIIILQPGDFWRGASITKEDRITVLKVFFGFCSPAKKIPIRKQYLMKVK